MTALAHSYQSEIIIGLQISLLKVVYSHFREFMMLELGVELNLL